MAKADYKSCDVCGAKTFYDVAISYHEATKDNDYDPAPLGVGEWVVLCEKCAETHAIAITKMTEVPKWTWSTIVKPSLMADRGQYIKALAECLRMIRDLTSIVMTKKRKLKELQEAFAETEEFIRFLLAKESEAEMLRAREERPQAPEGT